MRHTILFVFLSAALALPAAAAQTSRFTLANETGLAYDNTYTLDLRSPHLDQLSCQAVYSTTTFSPVAFTDGRKSTGTYTVSASLYANLHGTRGSNTLTVVSGKNESLAAAYGTNTVTVSSNSPTALRGAVLTVNGRALTASKEWYRAPLSSNTAVSLANAINANTPFRATQTSGVITITCPQTGTACNAYTLASSTVALALGGATFSGGHGPVSFTLNSRPYTNGIDWVSGRSSTNTAASIASAIANNTSAFTVSASSNVVTITCSSTGTFCNAYTLSSSSSAALAAASARFTGGLNRASFAINGRTLTEGVDWTAETSATDTAKNISDAIVASAALNTIVTSTWTTGAGDSGIVSLTSVNPGLDTNYSLTSSSYSVLTPFAAHMRGGLTSGVVASVFTKSAHGLTTALPVLFNVVSGSAPQNLADGTTYYIRPVNANTFKLSTSKANAVANSVVTVSTVTGSGSFTLTPLAFSGTPSFKWQVSNDGTNWDDVSVSSVTFATPYTASSAYWDFGDLSADYLRLNVVGPTQGGMRLNVAGHARARLWGR